MSLLSELSTTTEANSPQPAQSSRGGLGMWLVIIAAVLAPVLLAAALFGYLALAGGTQEQQCTTEPAPVSVDAAVATQPVAGFGYEQLLNAATILRAGASLGMGQRDQTIAVMTAIGESSLRVVDHGDAAGADSRGLFQQRGNGAWGSLADRMDPTTSALNFFRALAAIPGRESMSPTQVAHAVQRNADPNYYSQFWTQAVTITAALAQTSQVSPTPPVQRAGQGQPATGSGGGAAACAPTAGPAAAVSTTGWALPTHGRVSSPFGWRVHPITGVRTFHSGDDLANTCGTPIYAAADGVVTRRGFDSGGNGIIAIDHGRTQVDGTVQTIQTHYLHMYDSGMFVNVGEHVTAGQEIAQIGSSGSSTGCHLHFEVEVGDHAVDPLAFMAKVGLTLGQ